VLIQITERSELVVLQTTGVRIGFIDFRVERDALTIIPEVDQAEEIMTAISGLKLISAKEDDPVRTAAATIMRIGDKRVIVAKGPK
jgi:hypothetical protein